MRALHVFMLMTTLIVALNAACYDGNSGTYRGTKSTTKSGKQCQYWASQLPHSHRYTAKRYPKGGLDKNYCRDPTFADSLGGPWCYTMDRNTKWEYCFDTCSDVKMHCKTLYTSCNHGGGKYGGIEYLDRQAVACGKNQVLKDFRLIRCDSNSARYRYTCCLLLK